MKHALLILLLFCAPTAPVFSQDIDDPTAKPVATIIGPTTGRPGDILILSTDGKAKHADWSVDASEVNVPKDGAAEALEKTFDALRKAGYDVEMPELDEPPIYLELDKGQRLLLSSYIGTYRVSLAVGNDNGVDQTVHKVIVSGSIPTPVPVPIPIPTPTPTPTPTPVPTDVSAKITAAVKAAPADAPAFRQVANTYEMVADQIKGGLLKTSQQVVGLTDAVTSLMPAWTPIKTGIIEPHLKTLTLNSAGDYEPMTRQIATAVKAGLTDTPPPPVVDPPIPVTSLHVLIIEEMDDRSKLPASQVNIFSSTKLIGWFNANGVHWRMFDDDVDQSFLDEKWKAAMARPRQSLPWVVASNGTKGYEGPLPKSVDELTALLEKYK